MSDDDEPTIASNGEPEHDLTGLDLARAVAEAYRGSGVRRRAGTPAPPKPGDTFFGRRRRTLFDPQSSGAHPDERDPQTLDVTLGRLVSERGWRTDVAVHGVFSRWDAMVGRDVAQHVRPVSYVRDDDESLPGGRLVVQTDSTAWATQMRLLAPTVVRRLNEELGDGTVRVIDVQGPNVPSWKRGRRSVRDGRGPRDTYG